MNEAELVLTHVLNCDRLSLYLNQGRDLSKDKAALISAILGRRAKGEPVQYILGQTEFMGLEFKVDRRVLIPRPETEILVEVALKIVKAAGIASPKILDLGTGSGCIAVSLAKNIPQGRVSASDISLQALELARENADLHQVSIAFIQSNLFTSLGKEGFDLIVSNPPYVATFELSTLAREIAFEPALALEGGQDGLDFYRRISNQAAGYLQAGGFLILEIGLGQREPIENMLINSKNFEIIEIVKDYNNIERVIVARNLKING